MCGECMAAEARRSKVRPRQKKTFNRFGAFLETCQKHHNSLTLLYSYSWLDAGGGGEDDEAAQRRLGRLQDGGEDERRGDIRCYRRSARGGAVQLTHSLKASGFNP